MKSFHCLSLQQASESKTTDLHDTMSPYQQSKHYEFAPGLIRGRRRENWHSWVSLRTWRKRRRPLLVHLEEGLKEGVLVDKVCCDSHIYSLKK